MYTHLVGESANRVTVLLRKWRAGDAAALDEIMRLVYDELHRLAGAYMRRERAGHSLSPTDLVSEAVMMLIGEDQPEWADRAHFLAVVARHMRQVLVDHARRRNARKRGSGERAVEIDENLGGAERPADLVALDDALKELAALDVRKAQAIELRFFGGMSHKEIAAVLEVHENTIIREMRLAEAWLARHLKQG